MAFAASVKTSALNWPHHRGTATAFPVAAFGLSAFFFSLVSSIFFPGNPGKFLLLLSIGTFSMIFTGFFFLRVVPHTSSYHAVPADSGMVDSRELRRSTSHQSKLSRDPSEPGTSPEHATATASNVAHGDPFSLEEPATDERPDLGLSSSSPPDEADERSSLMSQSTTTSSMQDEILVQTSVDKDRSHRVDIRGWNLLKSFEFWQLFLIMGILSGIGLMTIKYVEPHMSYFLPFDFLSDSVSNPHGI